MQAGSRRRPPRPKNEDYLIEPFVSGVEGDLGGVLEQSTARWFALHRSRSVRRRRLRLQPPNYLLKSTQQICPGRFAPEVSAATWTTPLKAHRALSWHRLLAQATSTSRRGGQSISSQHAARAYRGVAVPKALKAQGIKSALPDFLHDQSRSPGAAR